MRYRIARNYFNALVLKQLPGEITVVKVPDQPADHPGVHHLKSSTPARSA